MRWRGSRRRLLRGVGIAAASGLALGCASPARTPPVAPAGAHDSTPTALAATIAPTAPAAAGATVQVAPGATAQPGPSSPATQPRPGTPGQPEAGLRALARSRGLLIGSAVAAPPLRADQAYRTTLAREFDLVVPENAMKFAPVHPSPAYYAFDDADAIVAFAQANGMAVRGHTLVWHRQVPSWLDGLGRADLLAALEAHVATVVGRYRGQVFAWDVVNEALDDPGGRPRDSVWSRTLGPDYLDHAFRFAHAADPAARLFYNDYGTEGMGPKSDAAYALVRGMLERGVPVHGVGLQSHFALPSAPRPPPSTADLAANMARLGALGLDVHVTELDVRTWDGRGSSEEKLAQQATVYRSVVEAALASPNCRALLVWGFGDKYSWIPASSGHPDAATLMDESFRPKPAYAAVATALAGPPTASGAVARAPLGRLGWGVDAASGGPWTDAALRARLADPSDALGRRVSEVVKRAEATLGAQITPVAVLQSEGTLFTDPRHRASTAATAPLSDVFTWALAARAAEPALAERCRARAGAAIDAWVSTYRPAGNPIDENPLIPLLQAIDLALPLLDADLRQRALAWAADLARQGDAFYAPLRPTDTRRRNNWASWRYAIRGLCAAIVDDGALLADTRQQVAAHVAQNVQPDGSTFDFHERDALHYHIYDLEPLVDLINFAPTTVDGPTEAAIGRALAFLEPFVTGRQVHVEFVNSPVKFDRERRAAGDPVFQSKPWDPKEARTLLWLARPRFPAIQGWSKGADDEGAPPRVKVLAALLGSP